MYRYLAAPLMFYATSGHAQTQPAAQPPAVIGASAELRARVADLVPVLNGGGDLAAIFHPQFLTQIPATQLRTLAGQMTAAVGKVERVASFVPANAHAGTATIAGKSGTIVVQLATESAPPHRITSLRITNVTAAEATLPAVLDAFRKLPGRSNFAIYDLGAAGPILTVGHAAESPLAVGSAFKLVILAELVRAIAAGERRWDDTVTLGTRELPGGAYTQSLKGTQLSLRTLAEKMISVSDNSATDLLLHELGREKVEAMQRPLGIADPARNRPFLGTMEAFKLKGIARLRERWLAADERGRRALLPEIEAAPTADLTTLFQDGKPVVPDRVEWFFSPLDLARVMDWLRRNTESGPAAEARRILAINSGVAPPVAQRYAYVGYKGGSEPGVMNMTLLLRGKEGGWRVLTAGWLDTQAPILEGRFAALVSRATELAAQ